MELEHLSSCWQGGRSQSCYHTPGPWRPDPTTPTALTCNISAAITPVCPRTAEPGIRPDMVAGPGPSGHRSSQEAWPACAVLDKAQHGRPQVVLLASEAGAGKTRLLLKLPTDASS